MSDHLKVLSFPRIPMLAAAILAAACSATPTGHLAEATKPLFPPYGHTACVPNPASPLTTRSTPWFAEAKKEWELGSQSDAADEGLCWIKASSDLYSVGAAESGSGPPPGYYTAAQELVQLASFPDTGDTPAQLAQFQSLVLRLNAFFGTEGRYGISPPSNSRESFVATLQREVRSGTLSSVPAVPAIPRATIECPVLPPLAAGIYFGCKIRSAHSGFYIFVGQLQSADGTTYYASAVKGKRRFQCAKFLSPSFTPVITQMGSSCD
jgi:hypothetical protein